MPAHPRFFQQIADRLAATTDPARRDELLDEWLDIRDRATEWDADQWGLNPDLWCAKERAEMDHAADDTTGAERPVSLGAPCARCGHAHNWHENGVCIYPECARPARHPRCGCTSFTPDDTTGARP